MRKQPIISLCNVDTGYRGKIVSKKISADIFAGELTCLMGPNGAGKSTLLKTLCGFIPTLSGRISMEGKNAADIPSAEISRLVSVVLTDHIQSMNMTVFDLVSIGRTPYTSFFGKLKEHDIDIVDRSISATGIGSLRDKNINMLSDGERQKVMIAKALAQETPIIILDEPTAFLDYPSKVEVMRLLRYLARTENKTIFMSTHDIGLAMQLADRLWLIDKKYGLTTGIPEDLAINGILSKYFESNHLKFDISSGQFEILHPAHATVEITGSGPVLKMVRKALARYGYVTNKSDGVAAYKISVSEDISSDTDKKFKFTYNGVEYSTMEDLLDAIDPSHISSVEIDDSVS